LPFIHYPNDARNWADIVEHYASIADTPFGSAMESLVRRLQAAGYVDAGLHGMTSMFELKLGRSKDVQSNPHLRIGPAQGDVQLTYEDGSNPAWSVVVTFDELYERVERVLVKRARWFGNNVGESAG
jgi:hypothetical protein